VRDHLLAGDRKPWLNATGTYWVNRERNERIGRRKEEEIRRLDGVSQGEVLWFFGAFGKVWSQQRRKEPLSGWREATAQVYNNGNGDTESGCRQ
jgi:hypothetical protein